MSWKKYKLGDILERKRNKVSLFPNEYYKLVTIKLRHQGVTLRQEKKGQDIKSNMHLVNEGDFILSGIDARNGAFGIVPKELDNAIVTNDFWCLEPKKNILRKDFFLFITSTSFFDYICNQCSDGTTQRIRLQRDKFFNYEITLPSIDEQETVVKSLTENKALNQDLASELTHQLDLVKQLRQAFLREAMQGKLVKQDSNDEPASVLLEKIKAEKKQLINDKKIKKQKALPSISKDEIPFEIPENWTWCRLGDICEKIGSGSTPKGSNYSESGFPFFRSQNIHDSGLVYDDIKFISESVQLKMNGTKVIPNDILLNITGGSLGRCALVPSDFKEGNVSQHVSIIRPIQSSVSYIHNLVLSPLVQQYIFNSTTGAGREGLPKYNLEQFVIPLPPFSEQKRIVAKLDELMQYCDQLEESIKNSQQQNMLLLQQVLREALEPNPVKAENAKEDREKESETIEETKVIPLKPTNVDYYRRTVLAAEIVWQLQKEPTLGHLKLQKLIFLCQRNTNMQLPTNFLKQAMGPYDPQLMRSIDKQLKQKKWFQYKKSEFLKYVPLEKSGEHQKDFTKYFSEQKDSIQYIIDTFRNKKSDIIEITATLYACLEEMHKQNIMYSEPMLLQMFYDWSERKEDFAEHDVKQVFKAMQAKGIIPNTFKN